MWWQRGPVGLCALMEGIVDDCSTIANTLLLLLLLLLFVLVTTTTTTQDVVGQLQRHG